MEEWQTLEFEYAKRLRECPAADRRALYDEAYSRVAAAAVDRFKSDDPADRTAGTSVRLVDALSQLVSADDKVLEVGCGRGYTCLGLAPRVASVVGTDVSQPVLQEARDLLQSHGVTNTDIRHAYADDLTEVFPRESFTKAISIDVVEHLHPEDARLHFKQVNEVLKPGGEYIIVMPNRTNGPHDVTKHIYPEAAEPLGFHLNESTYGDMTRSLAEAGFQGFRSFCFTSKRGTRPLQTKCISPRWNMLAETLYKITPGPIRRRIPKQLIGIHLIARKAS